MCADMEYVQAEPLVLNSLAETFDLSPHMHM